MRFSSKRNGVVEVRLDGVEGAVLASVAGDLVDLLGTQEDTADDTAHNTSADPLASIVGLPAGSGKRPVDPALARLLPDAYGDDDEAATEFRRYTEADLRAGKRAGARTLLATLEPVGDHGGRLLLDRAGQDAWLGCLNDLRLVLGTRLEVTEDTELDPTSDDPRQQGLQVYGWLGYVQESLLEAMTRGRR